MNHRDQMECMYWELFHFQILLVSKVRLMTVSIEKKTTPDSTMTNWRRENYGIQNIEIEEELWKKAFH